MKFLAKIAMAAMAMVLATQAGHAAVATFTDVAAFNGGNTVIETHDFNGLTNGRQPNPLVLGSASLISSNDSGLFVSGGFGLPGKFIGAQNTGHVDILLQPGFDAIGFDLSNLFGTRNFDVQVFAIGGALLETLNVSRSNEFEFLGFASSSADIGKVSIIGAGGTFEAIDNLVLGNAVSVSAVPVPAALPLLATGLVGLGLLGRRKKKIC